VNTKAGDVRVFPQVLAADLENFYRSVARQLDVDVQCVIRVALGEQHSREIELAMEHELKRITGGIDPDRGEDRELELRGRTPQVPLVLPVSPELPICHAGAGKRLRSPSRRL
jgi:hypothetical protein